MRPRSPFPENARWRRLLFWLAPAGLVCLFPLFFIGPPGWSDGPLIQSAWNLGHPIFFALLTLTIRPWRFVSGWKLWASASSLVALSGLGIEYAQSFTTRGIDARDMFRNLTGLWVVLALQARASFRQQCPARDWLIRILAVGLLAIDLIWVTGIGIQQAQVNQLTPHLYDFQKDDPEPFWRGNVARSSGDICGPDADDALSIALTTRRYSGASLDNLPSDWSQYEGLALVLWNPQSYPIPLTLRINDRAHELKSNGSQDRYYQRFQIRPGINRIHLNLNDIKTTPRDREMDMTRIRRVMLFTSDIDQPGRLCLNELKLTRGDDASADLD
jgi:hypothetical protein